MKLNPNLLWFFSRFTKFKARKWGQASLLRHVVCNKRNPLESRSGSFPVLPRMMVKCSLMVFIGSYYWSEKIILYILSHMVMMCIWGGGDLHNAIHTHTHTHTYVKLTYIYSIYIYIMYIYVYTIWSVEEANTKVIISFLILKTHLRFRLCLIRLKWKGHLF